METKVVSTLTVSPKFISLGKKTSQNTCFLKSHYISATQAMKKKNPEIIPSSLFSVIHPRWKQEETSSLTSCMSVSNQENRNCSVYFNRRDLMGHKIHYVGDRKVERAIRGMRPSRD